MKYRIILLILGVSLIAASCNKPVVQVKPTVSGSSIEVPVSDPTPVETKTETPLSPKPAKIAVSDLVIPTTPEEQQAQIDQNTIKNIEQDSHLDRLDKKTDGLQNQIDNLPSPTPSPVSAPVPTPVPTPTPTPTPVVDSTKPQFVVGRYYSCASSGCGPGRSLDISPMAVLPDGVTFQSYSNQLMDFPAGVTVATDETTTAVFSFYQFTDTDGNKLPQFTSTDTLTNYNLAKQPGYTVKLISVDNNLSIEHHVFYKDLPLDLVGVSYFLRIEFTDAAGNKTIYGNSGLIKWDGNS